MKNKRFLSLVMAIVLAASLFAGISVTASADGEVVDYSVKSGDYLYKICKNQGLDYYACKSAIMILNGFTTETQMNRIYVGQHIKLPATNALAATVSTTTTVSIGGSSTGTGAGTGTTVSTTTTSAGNDTVAFYLVPYTVKSGDTLYNICNALGTSYNQYSSMILSMNGINSVTHIFANKTIVIPVNTKPASGTYYTVVNHKVSSGETMTSICNTLGIGYSAYYKIIDGLNGGVNLNWIKVGQNVLVPTSKTISSVSSAPAAAPVVPSTGEYTIGFKSGANGNACALVNGKMASSADEGTSVTIQATPDSGYVVKSIKVTQTNGNPVSVSDTAFTMPANDVIIEVLFEKGDFSVKVSSTGKGTASVFVNGAVANCANNGDTIVLDLVPEFGYQVTGVTYQRPADDSNKVTVSKNSQGVYSFRMPNHNVKINVTFGTAPKLNLVTNKTGNGKVSFEYDGSTVTSAYANSTFIVNLEPAANTVIDHYKFKVTTKSNGAKVDYTRLSDTSYSVTITSEEEKNIDVTVTAVFITGYELTSNSNESGCGAKFKVAPNGTEYKNAVSSSYAAEGWKVYVIPQLSGKYKFTANENLDNILVTTGNGKSKVQVAFDKTNKCYTFDMPAADVNVKLTVEESRSTNHLIRSEYSAADALDFRTFGWYGYEIEKSSFAAGDLVRIEPIVPPGVIVKSVTCGYIGVDNFEVKKDYNGQYWVRMPDGDLWIGVAGIEDTSDNYYVKITDKSDKNCGTVVPKIDGKSISGNARIGSVISLDITPNSNYSIEKVFVTSTSAGENWEIVPSSGDGKYYYVVAPEDATNGVQFEVRFKDNTPKYTISNSDPKTSKGTYTLQIDGNAKPYGPGVTAEATAGETIKLKVSPEVGYEVNTVEVDGIKVSLNANGVYKFEMPEHNVTTKVTFKEGS